MKPMTERDEKGRIRHTRLSCGTEHWYYAAGNLTHYRWSDGDERGYDYDASGNLTHERWSDGTEYWYGADGRVTKWKDKNGTLHTNGDEDGSRWREDTERPGPSTCAR